MAYHSKINKATVSYQYWYCLFYFKIHLLRLCSTIVFQSTTSMLLQYVLFVIVTEHFISHILMINLFVIFSNTRFAADI